MFRLFFCSKCAGFLFKMFYSNSCITLFWEYPRPYFFSSKVTFCAEPESSIKKNQHLSSLNVLAMFPFKATLVAPPSSDACMWDDFGLRTSSRSAPLQASPGEIRLMIPGRDPRYRHHCNMQLLGCTSTKHPTFDHFMLVISLI